MTGGRLWPWFAALGALSVAGLFLYPVEVYRTHSFVCEITGSTCGYRTGPTGGRTNAWYRASALEAYIARETRLTVEHDWKRLGQSGKNYLGETVTHYCPILPGGAFDIKDGYIDEWIARHNKAEVLSLYDALRVSDPPTRDWIVEGVNHEVESY